MRDVFYTLNLQLSVFLTRLKIFLKRHPWLLVGIVIALVLLLPMQIARAQGATDVLIEGFTRIVTWFLGLILKLLSSIIIFLVEILISFAQYNDFGNALPVQTGWVIVRDVCNMFFIVILLVSAFATIIGYDSSFHYKAVLPKLLLMAILINFSKTLVMLMIDFSQVVMLTFVNAFSQAAAGNFINAFQLQNYTNISSTSEAAANSINIILSYLLGIVMSIIAVGIIIIMVAFIIARIVGLWILLIFSPAAFFVTALPGRLSKSLGSLGSDYWNRLGSLLTGGPVIAFFLWLTLATVQASSTGGTSMAASLKLHTGTNSTVGFLTQVGNTQGIATFVVAIAMMLMGLDAAVKASEAVGSGTLKSFAGYIKGKTIAAAKFAATSPYLAAKGTARAIDRRTDVTGKASMLGMATLGRMPVVGSLVRKPLMAGMTRNQRLDEKEAGDITSGMKNLSPTQKALLAGSIAKMPVLATEGERLAFTQVMTERAGDSNTKKIEKGLADRYQRKLISQNVDKDEAKSRGEKMAKADVMARRAEFLKTAEGYATGDQKDEISKILKENPHLYTAKDAEDYAKNAKKIADDPEALNKISTDAKSSMKFLVGGLLNDAIIWEDDKKKDKIAGIDGAKRDALMSKVKDRDLQDKLGGALAFIGNSPNGVAMKDIESALIQKDKAGNIGVYKTPVSTSVLQATTGQSIGNIRSYLDPERMDERLFANIEEGGKRMYSGNEQAARIEFAKQISDVEDKGRTTVNGVSVLDVGGSNALKNALIADMPLAEILKESDDEKDSAVSNQLANYLENSFNTASGAESKADFDSKMEFHLNFLDQIDSPNINSQTQNKILAGLQRGKAAEIISKKWDLMDRRQRKILEKAISTAVARAEDIAAKRTAGVKTEEWEDDVEKLVANLKTELPETAVKEGDTVIRRAAPSSIRRILHET